VTDSAGLRTRKTEECDRRWNDGIASGRDETPVASIELKAR
jgi:hypothetical protein